MTGTRARAGLAALAVAACSLALAGCGARLQAFRFETADGRSLDIRVPGAAAGSTTFTAPGAAATPLYRVGASAAATQGQAFALSYAGSVQGAMLSVLSDRRTVAARATLGATGGAHVRFLLPVTAGTRIWGFQVSFPGGADGTFALEGAGTAAFVHGFAISGGLLTVDGSIEVSAATSSSITARFGAAARKEMAAAGWRIGVTFPAGAPARRIAFDGPDRAHAAFVVDAESGPPRLDLGRESIGFLPTVIRITGAVAAVEIREFAAGKPLPADLGTVLASRQSQWRRPEFEFYSWTRFPSVLVFDTASYAVQDGLFKRLAFFVEKAGYAGRIWDPESIAGEHGYNAHDYKADDLARFFDTAARGGLALLPLEQDLLAILLDAGIVVKTKQGYSNGEGSVLSISRSSSAVLRELLLAHEAFHGVYFSLQALRDAASRAWDSLSPLERDTWKAYLASRKYDSTNNYLVVNEFQAYLLQQERASVSDRQVLMMARLKASSSEGARLASEMMARAPRSFLGSFEVLDEALRAAGAPPGGRVIGVRPAVPTGNFGEF